MRKSEKIIHIVFGTLLFLSLVTSISYALWSMTRTQENPNQLASGCFSLTMTDGTSLELFNEFPVIDVDGLQKEPYTLSGMYTVSTQLVPCLYQHLKRIKFGLILFYDIL